MVNITIKMPDETSSKMMFPVQEPHRILEYLISECKLTIPDSQVEKYWKHLEEVGDEIALESKEFRRIARAPVWPIGIHGDEAAIGLVNAPSNKVVGIFLNVVLFRPTATRLSRYLLWAIETEKIWNVMDTYFPVLDLITQSLIRCAEQGVCGRRMLLTEIRGDQVWFRQIFRHRAYWIGDHICFRCKATTHATNLNYAIYDSENGWSTTIRSTDEFIEEELSRPLCYSAGMVCMLIF